MSDGEWRSAWVRSRGFCTVTLARDGAFGSVSLGDPISEVWDVYPRTRRYQFDALEWFWNVVWTRGLHEFHVLRA